MAKTLDEAGVKRLIQEIKGANKNLNTPIPISTENTTESMAQNMKNIADYVEKAKAAGIANVNGMSVTCLIDDDYSGVGYVYGASDTTIIGVLLKDDITDNICFRVDVNGSVVIKGLIVSHNESSEVTSDMLAKGARKPIILTSGITEVDEETYQKLLSDDVDVVFKAGLNYCTLTFKYEGNTSYSLYFTSFSVEGETEEDVYLYGYEVTITKNSPHTCDVIELLTTDFSSFLTQAGYLYKNSLSPILKEIDLTGTHADRKAKLNQFETDWKAFTGSETLMGARFVGKFEYNNKTICCLFTYDIGMKYGGVFTFNDGDDNFLTYMAVIEEDPICVPIHITPATDYSHLEAITIYTDNTPEHMQANLDNIAAYEDNLLALGVDTVGVKAPIIPIYTEDRENHGFIQRNDTGLNDWTGICTAKDWLNQININIDSGEATVHRVALYKDVVDKTLNAKTLEAVTIKTGNSPDDKNTNKAAIQVYVDNLKALGVDTTKGYMIPVKLDNGDHGFIMGTDADGEHTGVIKRVPYNYGGGWIKITTNGTYHYLEILTTGSYSLTTTSKKIVDAINEINALAQGVKAFGAIELKASDNDLNKAAITAYLKILTDAGVSTTNGYAVPVRITGNSQEYHGMLNIGTGVLLSGVVTDVNENHHYPFNVSTTDGAILFDENNYFLEKTSNEVTEMLDAIKYSYTSVPFTDTTLSNKAQLEVFLSKVPNATVMHCTYNEIWAGTLHKINGDWYGLLVKNTNSPADNINVKLSADGTIIKSNSAQ